MPEQNDKAQCGWTPEDRKHPWTPRRIERALSESAGSAGVVAAVATGSAVWRSMDTAPQGGGAERTDDPKWVEPPKLLMAFDDGSIEICHWDWYYAPGGNGHTPGVSAWIGAEGEQVARFQGDPIAWMPLPLPPNTKGSRAEERE